MILQVNGLLVAIIPKQLYRMRSSDLPLLQRRYPRMARIEEDPFY